MAIKEDQGFEATLFEGLQNVPANQFYLNIFVPFLSSTNLLCRNYLPNLPPLIYVHIM